jgi:His/Glu/Gln/Arg/opine family amino acid ABC transporter permease subunit
MDVLISALTQAAPLILGAALLTAACSVAAGLLALIFGIPAGVGRLSRVTLIRSVSTFYVETMRGTPLLLQLLVWYFGVAILVRTLFNVNVDISVYNLLTALNSNSLYSTYQQAGGSAIVFGVIGLGFNYGAYIAEVVRAGVQAVDPGETEASLSLGMSGLQTMRYVVLPQALRLMTPALTSNLIALIQDTAFLQILGVYELSLRAQSFTLATSNFSIRSAFYVVELALYFVICYSLALVSQRLERRTAHTLAGAH